MARRASVRQSTRSRRADDQVDFLKVVARMSGGNRRLADALTRGGFRDLPSALAAVLEASEAYSATEGRPMIELIVVRNRRRSWAVQEQDGRYHASVFSAPSQEPQVVRGPILKHWFREAHAIVKPVLQFLRQKKFRAEAAARLSVKERFPEAFNSLNRAGLFDLATLVKISPSKLAASLVHAEHPEAGRPSVILRNANTRPEN